ncbi:MAG: aminotransferase class I/II-fold pyridoxal phosphate-dependent enzyme [Chitinivibrionales bacterium]|nr:aminotransferase class I/II-fold pyridoxal phosphate-dependent enzyme [Chitinivibrionales bacterium]MBD3395762.1 aminotransferase class I/II-fold pyridoxal phosphate-dependent enzyme [Chitinivibrionales bacterium]
MNPQAVELNEVIEQANPHALALLSEKGKGIFFPKKGILAQTADARRCGINATIGAALEDNGSPMCLRSIADNVRLDPKDVFPYAPSYGKPEMRRQWHSMIYAKNPSLGNAPISTPVATNALTHGLSVCGYLFCDPGDRVIIPDMFWGNYRLILENAYSARLDAFPTFAGGGSFNVTGLKDKLAEGGPGKKIVLFNSPNNPTGYTPTVSEAGAIRDALVEAADAGNDIVVLIDDAYFGLVYEDGVFSESMFALLAGAHERILAVKLDGATKEDYVWGLRVGFITMGCRRSSPEMYASLEAKLAGCVRGGISNASHVGQSLLLAAYTNENYAAEKKEKFETLKRRYSRIREILAAHPEYGDAYEALPFNSGYFMCVRLKKAAAEAVRQRLLSEYSIGIIAVGDVIRVAFSSTPLDKLEELYAGIYGAAKDVAPDA